MGNLSTNFGVSGILRSRFMGQHLSDAPRALTTLTFEVIPLVDDTGLRSPSVTLCTKFEVCRRSDLEDMTHLLSQLSRPGDFGIESSAHYPYGRQPSYHFGCF